MKRYTTAVAHKRTSFLASVTHAVRGIEAASSGRNFKIQVLIGAVAIVASLLFRLSHIERAVIVLCVGLVLTAEVLNTALERLLDFVSKERRPEIREIKDLMAAAVLLLSFVALVAGLWIFAGAIFFS